MRLPRSRPTAVGRSPCRTCLGLCGSGERVVAENVGFVSWDEDTADVFNHSITTLLQGDHHVRTQSSSPRQSKASIDAMQKVQDQGMLGRRNHQPLRQHRRR